MSELNDGHRRDHRQQGAIARALLWVLAGLVLAVVAFVAVTPELVGNEAGIVMELVGLVGLAAVPGMVLLVLAAVRRKRLGLDDPGPTAGDEVGSDHHRPPHPDQDR
jgi:Flp pilus assembly protein TadB